MDSLFYSEQLTSEITGHHALSTIASKFLNGKDSEAILKAIDEEIDVADTLINDLPSGFCQKLGENPTEYLESYLKKRKQYYERYIDFTLQKIDTIEDLNNQLERKMQECDIYIESVFRVITTSELGEITPKEKEEKWKKNCYDTKCFYENRFKKQKVT